MTKKLAQYVNGSYLVTLYLDGTKIREQINDEHIVEFPESIDLKITEACNQNCPYCHESSKKDGNHAKIENIDAITNNLSPGVEIAIGGGNPFEHPQLEEILTMLKNKRLIANITVNEAHLIYPLKMALLKEWQKSMLIYGIGISSTSDILGRLYSELPKNVVWHCILGMVSPFDIVEMSRPCKVLLLGDKRYGRGSSYFIDDQKKIDFWKFHLPMVLSRENLSVSFDNLAIEQLDLKRILPKKIWDKHYMGDDGQFSMYVDAVKMQYAKNSISERKDISDLSTREIFQRAKGETK